MSCRCYATLIEAHLTSPQHAGYSDPMNMAVLKMQKDTQSVQTTEHVSEPISISQAARPGPKTDKSPQPHNEQILVPLLLQLLSYT